MTAYSRRGLRDLKRAFESAMFDAAPPDDPSPETKTPSPDAGRRVDKTFVGTRAPLRAALRAQSQ